MKTLECSTAGDKRFSALCARVLVNGKCATIEEHYQLSKLFYNTKNNVTTTGTNITQVKAYQKISHMKLVGFKVGSQVFPIEALSAWYMALWYKYLNTNRELLTVIHQYDKFTDRYKATNTVNSQADVMAYVKKYGLIGLKNYISPFLDTFKKAS